MDTHSIDHINFKRIRPRIRLESDLSLEQLKLILKEQLSKPDKDCEGKVMTGFATIYPVQKDQHYWSPQLTLTMEETENGSLIKGLYGPKPSVWTMFVFFYSLIGFLTIIATLISLSYWSLGIDSMMIWSVPLLLGLFLSFYLVAYAGQKFGHKQMVYVHRFVEECLGQKIETD